MKWLWVMVWILCIHTEAWGQTRIVVPFAPGGTTDVTARAVAQGMERATGTNWLVENRPGGNLGIAINHVLRHAPDAHVLFMGNSGMLAFNHYTDASVDTPNPWANLRVVALVVKSPMLLMASPVHAHLAAQQFIWFVQENQQHLNYGVNGRGSSLQMAADLFQRRLSLTQIQSIYYTGAASAVADLRAGRINYMFDSTVVGIQLHQSQAAIAMAVTSAERSRIAPHVPTFLELGIDLEFSVWQGLFARSDTPDHVVAHMNHRIRQMLRDDQIRHTLHNMGVEQILDLTVDQSQALIRREQHMIDQMFSAR